MSTSKSISLSLGILLAASFIISRDLTGNLICNYDLYLYFSNFYCLLSITFLTIFSFLLFPLILGFLYSIISKQKLEKNSRIILSSTAGLILLLFTYFEEYLLFKSNKFTALEILLDSSSKIFFIRFIFTGVLILLFYYFSGLGSRLYSRFFNNK